MKPDGNFGFENAFKFFQSQRDFARVKRKSTVFELEFEFTFSARMPDRGVAHPGRIPTPILHGRGPGGGAPALGGQREGF